ncbi:MAG TPA: Hsp70 family protein [Polyangiaceae bacterium]|jgi:molecular chaperone DnaK (HSP70)
MTRCANCLAPLRLDAGPIVTCAWCGAQTDLGTPAAVAKHGTKTGRRLEGDVAFVVTPTLRVPFLQAGAALPIHCTETVSTSRDAQEELKVHMMQGERELARFAFPIRQRAPRGVPKIALTVRVSESGAMSLTLAEPGTDNVMDYDAQTWPSSDSASASRLGEAVALDEQTREAG